MKEYNFTFSTESKSWKIAIVVFWIASLIWTALGEYWFSAGFATCALLDSVLGLFSFLYDSQIEEGDEE